MNGALNTISFSIIPNSSELFIAIFVDGIDLAELVDKADDTRAPMYDTCLPYYCGDYKIEETLLGMGLLPPGQHTVLVFACGCGYSGCSATYATALVEDERITLGDFKPHKKPCGLRPLTFSLDQFSEAVKGLNLEIAEWQPSPPPRNQRTVKKPPILLPPIPDRSNE